MASGTVAKTKRPCRALMLLVCLSLAPAAVHASHESCSDCHTEGKELKQSAINPLCLSCHSGGNRNDHKTGIPPKGMKSPLPLDKEGKMSCITCHDQHGKTAGSKLLRMNKNALCLDCHDK